MAGGDKVRAKKHLGQHFLKDLTIAQRIVDALGGGHPEHSEVSDCEAESQTHSSDMQSLPCGRRGISAEHLSEQSVSSKQRDAEPAAALGGGRNPSSTHPTHSPSTGGVSAAAAGAVVKLPAMQRLPAVLEVGPGMGVLTQFLLQRNDIDLSVAEIDGESVEYLRAHYPTLRIIEGDFLRMNLEELMPTATAENATGNPQNPEAATTENHTPKELHIIGNFPYNISSQIFFKVLEHRDIVPQVVGMVQREVATRIAEQAGSRDYGILSVLLQAWYDIEYLFTVSEGVFDPPPKVKSAVIRLTRNARTELGCDEKAFRTVVKAAFGQRRKMLRNALRAAFDIPDGADHRFLNMRAEQLTVENFIELTIWLNEILQ